jgi:hypothetical protein
MADEKRYLSFSNLADGQPIIATCSECGRRFEAHPETGKRIDDLILTVRAEFEAHRCEPS